MKVEHDSNIQYNTQRPSITGLTFTDLGFSLNLFCRPCDLLESPTVLVTFSNQRAFFARTPTNNSVVQDTCTVCIFLLSTISFVLDFQLSYVRLYFFSPSLIAILEQSTPSPLGKAHPLT
ncbi:hypothetical protein CDAR_252941 [Caerostris darwini]|uniref:Uncharacterized protein n=1 Tax=Caerostris darwini TaxID=1538125 RepID=A0AAV4Q7B3_9ARAC|nr:hypothetical protein CDAR_252941 [Caerostris darwini]